MNMPTDVMHKILIKNGTQSSWWSDPSIPSVYEFYTDEAVAPGTKKQYTSALVSPQEILTNAS
jgi:hypothetical protein